VIDAGLVLVEPLVIPEVELVLAERADLDAVERLLVDLVALVPNLQWREAFDADALVIRTRRPCITTLGR